MSGDDFFEGLSAASHDPRWGNASGAVRFDVRDGATTATTVVRVDHGEVTIERGPRPADCVIALDRPVFDRLVGGQENLMALVLRGAAVCSGDPQLLLVIQRAFPGPPTRRPAAAGARDAG